MSMGACCSTTSSASRSVRKVVLSSMKLKMGWSSRCIPARAVCLLCDMHLCTDCFSVVLAGPYVFQQFEALQGAGLQPAAAEALKLLHRLAADPGIVAIMRAHRWTVGKLKEMPPEVKLSILAPQKTCPADPPAVCPFCPAARDAGERGRPRSHGCMSTGSA